MRSMQPIRIGVAGLGKMGLLHAAVFNSIEGCQVVAASDPSVALRSALGGLQDHIEIKSDALVMLDQCSLDAIVIATPVSTHVPIAMEAARRGIPFFVDKPLTTNAAEASDLMAMVSKSALPHMVGFMTRFVDSFAFAKTLLDSGALGTLHRLSASIYISQLFKPGQGWRYDKKVAGGGVLLAQGSHLLDLLTWYFGPVKNVNAQTQCVYNPQIEDFAHLALEFQSGLRGFFDCSWSVRFRRTVEINIDVLGQNGSLLVSDDTVRLFLEAPFQQWPAGWSTWTAVDLYRGVSVDIGGPQYTREDEAFVQSVRDRKATQPDLAQALHVQRIVDAAYVSSEKNGAPEGVTT